MQPGRWLLALGLIVPLAAQQPASRPATPAAAPAPADDGMTLALYHQARVATNDAIPELQPGDLEKIAEAEAIRHPDLARDDAERAFRLALGLSPQLAPDDYLGLWHMQVKRSAETAVIRLLTRRQADFDTAHALARSADIPRASLYSDLIGTAANAARGGQLPMLPVQRQFAVASLGPAFRGHGQPMRPANNIQPGYDVFALVRECQQLDGSFPYVGVSRALSAYGRSGDDYSPLVRLLYDAAAAETDPAAASQAVSALGLGHQFYPGLDQQLEMTIETLLRHLQQATITQPAAAAAPADPVVLNDMVRPAASRALELLRDLDPNRYAAVAAEYSDFSVPSQSFYPPPIVQNHGEPAPPPNFSTQLASARALPALTPAQQQARFRSLLAVANSGAASDPATAAAAAAELLDGLTDAEAEADLRDLGLFALRLATTLHHPASGRQLMLRCLDLADQQALQRERIYRNAPAQQRQGAAITFGLLNSPQIAVYGFAAQLDPQLALARAQQSSATDFKPLLLLQVALARELAHPWWQ